MKTISERIRKDMILDSDDLIVMVPHQKPPTVCRASEHPPIEDDGDNLCEGDHDCHGSMKLSDALDYTGHQQHAVAAKVAAEIDLMANHYSAEPSDVRAFLLAARGY